MSRDSSSCARRRHATLPLRPVALAAALAWPAGTPWAQQGAPTLPPVKVQGAAETLQPGRLSSPKQTAPVLDTPQSITVVPEALIKEQGASSLREVFRNVSGLSLTAGEGNPSGGDQLKLRGFSARDDIFVDGVRDVGIYFRDPFNLESVEVAKGPASVYSGRGSTGGNINQVSKAPRLGGFSNIDLTIGSDRTRRATVDLNHPLDATSALRLNLLAHQSQIEGRDFVENERYGFAPSLALGLGTPTRVTIGLLAMRQDNLPDYGIPNGRDGFLVGAPESGRVLPVDFSNFYGYLARDYEDVEVFSPTLKLEHDLRPDLRLRNQFRFVRATNDSVVSAPRVVNDGSGRIGPTTVVRGQAKLRDQVETLHSNQTDLNARLRTGGVEHRLVTGVELSYQQLSNRRRLDVNGPDNRLFDPDPTLPVTAAQRGVYNGTVAEIDTQGIGVYVADTLVFSPRWELSAGLRWDRVETSVRGIDVSGANPAYASAASRTDSQLSWRTGLVYKPRSNGSVYIGIGSSFDPAASSAAASAGVAQPAGGNNNRPIEAGFDVEPERTRSIELGSKWDVLGERLSLTGALFRIEKTQARNVDPVDGAVTIDGEQRVDGLELGAAGHLAAAWQLFASYTLLDSQVVRSNLATLPQGGELDNTPRHSFNLWTQYRFGSKLQLGFGALYVDDRVNQANSAANVAVTAPAYWRYDASASYPLTDHVQIKLNVLNLADKRYIEQHGTAQSIPGAGRTVLLTTSLRY